MMTNYEHIIEGGARALMEWQTRSVTTCQYCVGCDDNGSESRKYNHQHYSEMSLFCRGKQIAWLESEYAEQDSFEKLVCDLRKMLREYPSTSLSWVLGDVADRIEELVSNQEGEDNG